MVNRPFSIPKIATPRYKKQFICHLVLIILFYRVVEDADPYKCQDTNYCFNIKKIN